MVLEILEAPRACSESNFTETSQGTEIPQSYRAAGRQDPSNPVRLLTRTSREPLKVKLRSSWNVRVFLAEASYIIQATVNVCYEPKRHGAA